MGTDAGAVARRAAAETAPWLQRFARIGYAAKGVVYLLVGGLAVEAALRGGRATDSRGAFRSLLDAPLGTVLLGAVALGLFAYAIWRLYVAAADPERAGAGHRAYALGTALLHGGLALEATRLALGGSGGGGGESSDHWSARALAQPFGAWLLGAVALGVMGYGVAQLVRAWRSKLDEKLDLSQLTATQRTWVVRVSRFGLAARGVVFVLIGGFALAAARNFNASQSRGVGGALRALQEQPYGAYLLGAVALGLMGYGVYELLRARYRAIRAGGTRAASSAASRTQIRVERS